VTQYRRRPNKIEAHQWFKVGDHPQDWTKGGNLRRAGQRFVEKGKGGPWGVIEDFSEYGAKLVYPGDWVVCDVSFPSQNDVRSHMVYTDREFHQVFEAEE